MRTRVLVLFGLLLVAAAAVARADRFEQPPARTAFSAFPMQMGEWRGFQQPPFDDKVLKTLGLTDYLTRGYVAPDRAAVDLYIGYWSSQRQGETIHSPQNCLPGSGWQPVSQSTTAIQDPRHPDAAGSPVNRYVIQKGNDRQLVLYWFQGHGRIVASEYWTKFYLVVDAVRMNRSDGAVVRVITPIADGTAAAEQLAEQRARRFVSALLPQLNGFLPN